MSAPVAMDVDENQGGWGGWGGVEVLDEGGDSMRMLVRGVSSSFANAWRRTIMGEVDTLAIDQLQIHENTTMTHDELLFHRLGLIPLKLEGNIVDGFRRRGECNCDDGCPRCFAKFTLHVINRSDETVDVTTKDLVSHRNGVRPVRDDILIVKLGKNQEISFTAFAAKSNSRLENNAKWNPVTVAAYRPTARIKIDAQLMNKYLNPNEQRRVCESEPGNVLEYDEKRGCTVAHPMASQRATFVGDFMETLADIIHPPQEPQEPKEPKETKPNFADEKGGSLAGRGEAVGLLEEALGRVPRHPMELVHPMISMTPRDDEFLFPIVSSGCMPPRQIAIRALAALKARLLAIQTLSRKIDK